MAEHSLSSSNPTSSPALSIVSVRARVGQCRQHCNSTAFKNPIHCKLRVQALSMWLQLFGWLGAQVIWTCPLWANRSQDVSIGCWRRWACSADEDLATADEDGTSELLLPFLPLGDCPSDLKKSEEPAVWRNLALLLSLALTTAIANRMLTMSWSPHYWWLCACCFRPALLLSWQSKA